MELKIAKAVAEVLTTLINSKAKTATKYMSPRETIRMSQMTFKGKLQKGNLEIRITIGRPNYQAREFIKTALKAKEPFPIKKVQLKFPKGK